MLKIAITLSWKSNESDRPVSETVSFDRQLLSRACDILVLLLQIPSISLLAATNCIEAIQKGNIVGKEASGCISEIRLFMVSKSRQQAYIDEPHNESDESNILSDVAVIADTVLKPFLTSSMHQTVSMIALDLLPVCVSILSSAEKRKPSATDLASQYILDHICLNIEWNADNIFPLFNCICDMYDHMLPEHLSHLQVSYLVV